MNKKSTTRASPVIARLIERFDHQIADRAFSTIAAKYARSDAAPELLSNGRAILFAVAEHLESLKERELSHDAGTVLEIEKAWKLLIRDLARRLGTPEPDISAGISEFIAWAQRHAA